MWTLFAAVFYISLVRVGNYADRDFMSLWTGGHAVVRGVNPYDQSVWTPLRAHLGSTWMPDATAPFPFWTLMLFTPLAALSLEAAAAIWLGLMIVLTVSAVLLMVHEPHLGPIPLPHFLLLALSLFFSRWTTLGLFTGQMTGLLLLAIAGFIVLMERHRPFEAGMALALIAFKPNAFLFFVPLLGIWLIQRRYWRAIAGSSVGGLGMLAISWAVQPGWLSDWLAVSEKTVATPQTPTVWGLSAELAGEWWPLVGFVLTIVILSLSGCYLLRNRTFDIATATALALAVSLFATPYTWAYEHLLLFIPLSLFYRRNMHIPAVVSFVSFTVAVVIPWLLYWVATRRGLDTYSAFIPLLAAALPFVRLYRSAEG